MSDEDEDWFPEGITRLRRLISGARGKDDDSVEKIVEMFEERTKYSFEDDMERCDALEDIFKEAKLVHLIPKDSHLINYEPLRNTIIDNFNTKYAGRKGKKIKKSEKIFDNSAIGFIGLVEGSVNQNRRLKSDSGLIRENDKNQNIMSALNECKEELQKTLRKIDSLTKAKEDLLAKNWELQTKNEMLEKLLGENRNMLNSLENCEERLEKTLKEIQIKDRIINELNIKLKESEACNNKFKINLKELDKAQDEIKNKDRIIDGLNSKLIHFDIKEQEIKHIETKYKKNQGKKSAVVADLTKRIEKVTDELKNISGNLKKRDFYAKNGNTMYSNKGGRIKRTYYKCRERYVWVNPNIQTEQSLKMEQNRNQLNENRKIIGESLKSTKVDTGEWSLEDRTENSSYERSHGNSSVCTLGGRRNLNTKMLEKISRSANDVNVSQKQGEGCEMVSKGQVKEIMEGRNSRDENIIGSGEKKGLIITENNRVKEYGMKGKTDYSKVELGYY